jgi:Flp pilus assembly protein TadB
VRLLAEAVPPVAPVSIVALAALFALCALIVAIGMVKLVDAISRAFFGTVGGAVGWLPFAGRVVKRELHKIEQKISHALGSAERKLDAGVALTWNNCAHLVAYVGTEIEG